MGKCGRALGFAIWLTAATFAATTLTAWHAVALPVQSVSSVTSANPTGHWRLTHYLSADCACSLAVARHLKARGPLSNALEEVVLISSSDIPAEARMKQTLVGSGFRMRATTPADAASVDGIEGVPTLKIEAPDGSVRFRGGYQDRSEPEQYLDAAILSGLMASKPVLHPRVYGCATSSRMKKLLDPLSLLSSLRQ